MKQVFLALHLRSLEPLLVLLLTLFTAPAWATTIVEITSGHITAGHIDNFAPVIHLVGPGFMTGTALPNGAMAFFVDAFRDASPDRPFDMSVREGHGTLFHSTEGLVIREPETLNFTIQATPITIDLTVFNYVTPFTFTGSLVQDGETTLFSGHGNASVHLDQLHFVDFFSYDFLPTSIPEPATWLLVLAGVPILWWRRYGHASTRSPATESNQ